VVIASCLAFVPLSGGLPLSRLPLSAELVLSLGIAALVVVGIVPTRRLHLRLRPAWRFPPGVARRAGGLALVGVVELVVIDLASVVTITLANGRGSTGAIVIFNYASQVFNSVAAVLALSVVVSAFPVLSARDGAEFDRTCAGSLAGDRPGTAACSSSTAAYPRKPIVQPATASSVAYLCCCRRPARHWS
jgi:putative peptidoglycan lipid II flippase